VERLAREVRELDRIGVHEPDPPDAGRREIGGGG
jgi:hypothetical protein